MKKKIKKKLILNKTTLARLDSYEMLRAKAEQGSVLNVCTDESCSVLNICCGPTVPESEEEKVIYTV